jgi:hypothetical protein
MYHEGWKYYSMSLTVKKKKDFSENFLEDRSNRFLETLVITRLHAVITPNNAVSFHGP